MASSRPVGMQLRQSRSRALVRAFLPAVLAWYACGLAADAFLSPPGASRGLAAARLGRADLRGDRAPRRFMQFPGDEDDGLTDEERMAKEYEKIYFPPEKMWVISDDGMRLRENYPGARDAWGIFWAVIQPAVSLGFLIVGLSTQYGNLVDFNPITAKYLYFLKPTTDMFFFPQGIFMSFYGFFGFFLFGPLQWFLQFNNTGSGFCEFNKNTRRMVIIRDEELVKDIPFEDINSVLLEWTDLSVGNREVSIKSTEGEVIRVMSTHEELPKRILEKRAAILSDFLEKELEVEDSY